MKCELLRTSKDPSIRAIYKTRETLNAKLTRVWKATKAATIANAEVELNLKFPTQLSNQGLGHGNFNPNPSLSEKRKLVLLKQQSVWLQWTETAEPFDLSWQNIIWGSISPDVLKFV